MANLPPMFEDAGPVVTAAVERPTTHQPDRPDTYDAGVTGSRSRRVVSPTVAVLGRLLVVLVVYGACVSVAAVLAGTLAGLVPGLAGLVLFFVAGVAILGAGPSVAHWTVTQLFDFSR